MREFKQGDRVVVDNYPGDDYNHIVGVSGTVDDTGGYAAYKGGQRRGFVSVRLDEKVQNFGDSALFFPEELRYEYRAPRPWMNESNCAGLRPPKDQAKQTRAEAIMATGPVKMVKRIIELEDEVEALQREWLAAIERVEALEYELTDLGDDW